MKLRACVIGLGSMGKNHLRHYSEMDDVELVAIADQSSETLHHFENRTRARAYTDYREMLAKEKPDIVSVTVPTVCHRDIALEVIRRRIHVIIEKPIALSVAQGEEIIAAAQAYDVKLTVGHVERFNPVVTRMKVEMKRGTLGEVFRVHAKRQSPYPSRIQDIGVVIDLAPHDIDVMRYLTDMEIVRVYSEIENRVDREREDVLSSLMRFSNGTFALLEVDWLTPTTVREIAVSGEKGMFVANYLTQELYFYENGRLPDRPDTSRQFVAISEGEMRRLKIDRKEPLRIELEDFVDAVSSDRPPLVSGEDGLQALIVAQALVESGRKGEIIELPETGKF